MRQQTTDQTAVGSGVEESQWRRVHPVTPLARTWAVFAAFLAFITYQNIQILHEIADTGVVEFFGLKWIFIGIFVVILLIILIAGVLSWLSWRRMAYAVTDEAVFYREGILNRVQRHARLSRIQAVNISHPLIGRIFGLGRIDIEVAGGVDSNFKIGLLKTDDLEALRREIMMKSAGAKREAAAISIPEGGAGTPATLGATTPATSDQATANTRKVPAEFDDRARLIFKVPPMRLLGSLITNIGQILGFLFGFIMASLAVASMAVLWAPGTAMLPLLFSAVALFGWAWSQFSGNYNFTAYVTPDGIRVTSGLTATRAQTIAPNRIHGVTVRQPFFWRYFGWFKVEIIQAGFVSNAEDKVDHSILLPVGTRDEMLQALWMVYPDLGVDRPIDVINFGIEGEGAGFGFTKNPEQSKLFDPLVWRRRAIALTDVAILIRDGRLTRTFTVLPYGRLQSTKLIQGPWDRKRDLVNVTFNMVQARTNNAILHLDAQQGVAIHKEVSRLALLKRSKESPSEWAKRAFPAADREAGELFQERVPKEAPMTVADDSQASDSQASDAQAQVSQARGVQESGGNK